MSGGIRKLLLLLMVTAFVVCPQLYSVDTQDNTFSIGIVSMGTPNSEVSSFVEETAKIYCSRFLNSDGRLSSYIQNKNSEREEASLEARIHTAYENEDVKAVESERTSTVQSEAITFDSLPIQYTLLDEDPALEKILVSGAEGLTWYCRSQGMDALLLVSASPLSGHIRLQVEYFSLDTQIKQTVFDKLGLSQELYPLQPELALSLMKVTGHGEALGLVEFENGPAGLTVVANEKPLEIISNNVFLTPGSYELSLGAFGYIGKTLTLDVDGTHAIKIDAKLVNKTFGNLEMLSDTGNVNWFADGTFHGFSSEMKIDDYSLPLVAVATKDGFSTKAIQMQKMQNTLTFDLQPLWMNDSSLLDDAQKSFYGSLRSTIFLFGIYVACLSLSNTNGLKNQFWEPVLVATSGFTLVSSVNLIKSLASYAFYAGTNER
ncbi:hypothetical protein [uncultured Sphaerochaeta sp.]|uniref:hypothetical protein n=1 Tax=uncultured Sphaerochaeta sp. TaxID=886478 RepID=UPI002A0A7E25|nr:hypothetical protein [uncultured Sphaerochaeta sp.]